LLSFNKVIVSGIGSGSNRSGCTYLLRMRGCYPAIAEAVRLARVAAFATEAVMGMNKNFVVLLMG
jgi:hypothetical protein